MSERVPDWLVERYALGELPPERQAEVERALAAEPGRLEQLQASNALILRRYPPRAFAAEVRRRAAWRRGLRWGAGAVLLAQAAVAGLLLDAGPAPDELAAARIEEAGWQDVNFKGEPQLIVHRKREGEPEQLSDGDAARPGDVLQVGYAAMGHKHGVILSVDGRGVVTLHHPSDSGGSTALAPDGAVELPHAYRLDDAPEFERFYLVTSDSPLDPAALSAQAAAGPLRPGPGQAVRTFTVRKSP